MIFKYKIRKKDCVEFLQIYFYQSKAISTSLSFEHKS